MPQLEWLVAGGAIAGGVTMFWQQLKSVLFMGRDLAVSKAELKYWNAGLAFLSHCNRHYRRGKLSQRHIDAMYLWLVKRGKYAEVPVELMGRNGATFWRWGMPLQVKFVSVDNEPYLSVSCVRGSFNFDRMLQDSFEFFNRESEKLCEESQRFTSRFSVQLLRGAGSINDRRVVSKADFVGLGASAPTPGGAGGGKESSRDIFQKPNRTELRHKTITPLTDEEVASDDGRRDDPFKYLIYPPEIMALLVEAEQWIQDSQWYMDRGVPWRLGWLLRGFGGTGKTVFARAVACKLRIPLYSFDLGSMNDKEFLEHWSRCRSESPCVVLFEDYDTVFHGRKNIPGEDGGGLTFNSIINSLSGAEPATGILTIVTTNHVEHIDEVMGVPEAKPDGTVISSRPGRLDRMAEFPAVMGDACKRRLAEALLAEWPDAIEAVLAASAGEKASQFADRCYVVARKRRHEKPALHLTSKVA